MKLKLSLDLGNDAMTTGNDVGELIKKFSTRLIDDFGDNRPTIGDTGSLIDINGNAVGTWKFTR